MAWSKVFMFASALCLITAFGSVSYGEHTPETRRADISGMPAFCCSVRDCVEADVRFLGWKGNFGWVFADGQAWKVIGRGNGEDGIYIAPRDKTYICIRDQKQGIATCAMIKPKPLW